MKKILQLIVAVAALGAVVSCAKSTPGESAKQSLRYLADGEYEKFIGRLYFPADLTADQVKSRKTIYLTLLHDKGTKSLDERGGLKSVEILKEQILTNGVDAEVDIQYNYGNGDSEEDLLYMRLDKGKWLIVAEAK